MDQEGLAQAKERFDRLRSAAIIVASSAPLPQRESAWLDFIQYHGTIYSKLEQASKATPAARRWFEAKRSERKSDELLKYLLHARNVGEHTILRASGGAIFAVSGKFQPGGGILGISFDQHGKPVAVGSGAGDMKVHENEILLHAAKDRGVVYRPPREHLGQPIEGDTAREVARHALAHAERMIREAAALDPPSRGRSEPG